MLKLNVAVPALGAFLLVVAASSCSSPARQNTTSDTGSNQISQTTNSPTPSTTQSGQGTLSAADQQFVTEAAQGGLAEVQMGQLASQKATSSAVKQFGQRMVTDHTQANQQLQQLATQKGITLPSGVGNENQQMMDKLSDLSGQEFDRAYMQQMVSDHQKDVALYQQESQQGQDTDLQSFASQTLPILQEHLQQAQSVKSNLSQGG